MPGGEAPSGGSQGGTDREDWRPGAPAGPDAVAASGVIACGVCGTMAVPDAAWMHETDAAGRARWVCAACVRQHLRAIEARLDQEWW